MDNRTKFGILIAIIIVLLALMVWGEQRVRAANEDAIVYEEALGEEKLATGSINQTLRAKEDEIYQLKQQNKSLRDSIDILKSEVVRLNRKLRGQGQQVLANRKNMEEMQIREDSLVQEIGRLMNTKTSNTAAIDKMEQERLEISKGMAEVYEENEFLKDSIVNVTVDRETVNEELALKKRIDEIAVNTIVKYIGISPKKEGGKRARNSKNWTYTDIDLELYHPEANMLEDEIFMVVLWDMTKSLPISPREANAGRDTQGVTFSFTGNPVKTLRYPHYQDKDGDNYAVQVYYVKNGETYALSKGGGKSVAF
jgi:predicted  nucleic acid-binding Zn-ribbon protein